MIKVSSYIKNQWVEPCKAAQIIKDAATGENIAQIGHDGLDFESMLAYAREKGGAALRAMTFHERAKMIKALALYLKENKAPLYDLSFHTGATKADSMIDIDGGIQTMLVFASKGRRELPDDHIYLDGNLEELSRSGSFKGLHIATPLRGVGVHINAYNFPVWGMLEKLAPTLLAGVPAIIKPASQTAYLTHAAFKSMIESQILPDGAIQLISGSASGVMQYLTPQDVVSFTGSAATGRMLRNHPKIIENSVRFMAEQDSLNATILGHDVALGSEDYQIFLKEIVKEMTTKAGQKCTAIRRIFVPETLVEPIAQDLKTRLEKIKIGDPRHEDTRLGALVSEEQKQDVLNIARQIAVECRLICGDLEQNLPHSFLSPLLFCCDDPKSAELVHKKEAFGPVSTLMPYKNIHDAATLINKGEGSLVASVFTSSPQFANQMAIEIAPWHGRLYINNAQSAKESTGHGSPLPHLVHGGPGRAGGGEEMGGVRGVMHYMQRTAIQGSPDILSHLTNSYCLGSHKTIPERHLFTYPFNELEIGMSLTTKSRTITMVDIEHFAHFTGDEFYAHMDEEAAKASPFFEGRVAHGYLLLSFAAGLFVEPSQGPVLANTGLDNLRFLKPVMAGDSIYVSLTVMRKTKRNDEYGEVRWQVEIFNQNDELAAIYELLTMNAYAA